MHVIIYCNEGMDQGHVYLARELADDELMDERRFADQVADMFECEIDESGGHIPNCCGDLRVEFLNGEPNIVGERYQGSVCIWSGESFYFKRD
jgi:hypothetical protein